MQATLKPRTQRSNTQPRRGDARPATEKQTAFITRLREQRDDTGMGPTPENLSADEASRAIDWLLKQPYRPTPVYEPGVYTVQHSNPTTYVKVRVSKSTGKPYGLTLCPGRGEDAWDYAPGILRNDLSPITAAEAAQFGHETNNCIFCSRELTDERSISTGYGAVCASKNGLEWG